MPCRADLVARAVIAQFDGLPPKRKPAVRDNGRHEWVPLSGIVAERDGDFVCLALATGMKCLPAARLAAAHGNGLHDWHAEVLAVRAFNRFLLDACATLRESGGGGGGGPPAAIVARVEGDASGDGASHRPPFCINDGIKLHMYCSEAPCGDASMELTMAAQDDASPWPTPAGGGDAAVLPGRAYFSRLGIVRRKPARGDAPPTLSKSCSDKLALKQCTSLLSSLASLLVDPSRAYLHTLVLPESQHSRAACRRAFAAAGRMRDVAGASWPGGYAFRPFAVETTTEEFGFSRAAVQARAETMVASNLATAWSLSGLEENILAGVVQGRKLHDPKGASRLSRRRMWTAARELADGQRVSHCLGSDSYQQVKDCPCLAARRRVKAEVRHAALSGWVQNHGDSGFSLVADAA